MQDGTGTPERWLPVVGFEGRYEVSDFGRVRSLDRYIATSHQTMRRKYCAGRVLSPKSRATSRHLRVRLGQGNERYIHRLVLEAFVGPCPEGMEACHNNGDASDNRLVNLRYDSHSENMLDKALHGTDHERNKTHCPRNHLLAAPNLHAASARRGHRGCLACNRGKSRVYRFGKQGVELNVQAVSDAYYAEIMAAAA